MTKPNDIGKYEHTVELIGEYGLRLTRFVECFRLHNTGGTCLGSFETVDQLYYFVLGYQNGQLDLRKT